MRTGGLLLVSAGNFKFIIDQKNNERLLFSRHFYPLKALFFLNKNLFKNSTFGKIFIKKRRQNR
jgi:hypothetical protein